MDGLEVELDTLERVICHEKEPDSLDFQLLRRLTENFSDDRRIGEGGCGEVYKGILPNGVVIAVKKLKNSHTIDEKMFLREVDSLIKVGHQNIVRFLGYCSETKEKALQMDGKTVMAEQRERLLCFEYIRKGSLNNYLTDELRGFEWHTRYQIIKGICHGLLHLHTDKCIVHMDLKPANILLSDQMVPKITDFGLSRTEVISQTTSAQRLFSLGYCAPEFIKHGKRSCKSDIYSLGVIMIELVTGSKQQMPNITKVLRRWRHRWSKSSNHIRLWYLQVIKCLELAARCMGKDPIGRPYILDVLDELNKLDSWDGQIRESSIEKIISSSDDMLGIEPLELHFTVAHGKKQISCSIQLTNDTDYYMAFRIATTSLLPFSIQPDKGIAAPRSKCTTSITLSAQEMTPLHNRCKEEVIVQSSRIDGSLTAVDITDDTFNEERGSNSQKNDKVVDDVNLTVRFDMLHEERQNDLGAEMGSLGTSSQEVQQSKELSRHHDCQDPRDEPLKERRSLVLLLGTLAASITYQAGLNPPGGVWLENQSGSHGHNAGDPILLNTDDKRYSIFFYCNSAAFVASVVVILMVQIKALLKSNALHVAMILDLFGLMGAFIAGGSRTLRASVHLSVLAAAFLVYVTVIHFRAVKLKGEANGDDRQQAAAAAAAAAAEANGDELHQPHPKAAAAATAAADERKRTLKKRRQRLLLFAILMAAITYQDGLSPPGGFWGEGQGQAIGSPILEDMYPRRYKAFFYCNAISFMASMALIILLQDDKTYQPPGGIRFYGLYVCMLVGMLVSMASIARRVRTSIYVFVLVGGVIGFIAVLFALFLYIHKRRQHQEDQQQTTTTTTTTAENNQRKYMMLLAILTAIVTYPADLHPPGGVWPEGYAAGSPVLHDSNLRRYHVFFYSNCTSFIASIIIIVLLLKSVWDNMTRQQQNVQGNDRLLLMATNILVALDLVGLLVAYAAVSGRTMDTCLYFIVLVVAVVIYIVVHVTVVAVFPRGERSSSTQAGVSTEHLNRGNGPSPPPQDT